jgi:HEPN domain-containing protein
VVGVAASGAFDVWCHLSRQQCVEKYLKALLVAQGQPFPRTHDVVALSDLCYQNGIIISVDLESLERLAAYAVQVRYPGEDPSVAEAKEALQVAVAVRRFARKWLASR